MRLYISGPMSNLPEHNFPAFRKAAEELTAAGYDVIDPSENFGGRTDLARKAYMREDISNVLKADGVALLDGWEASAGSRLEVSIAHELNLEVNSVDIFVKYPDVPAEHRPGPGRVLNKGGTIGGLSGYATTVLFKKRTPRVYEPEDFEDLIGRAGIISKAEAEKAVGIKQETILEEAQRLVHGDRGHNYGPPSRDFSRTALIWDALFRHRMKDGEHFSPEDVGLAMVAVKMSREVNKHKRDNLVDLAGYAETVAMVWEERESAVGTDAGVD